MKPQVTSFRSQVFKEAHRLRKIYRWLSFGEVLRKCWETYRSSKRPKVKKVSFSVERIEQVARNINAFDTLYNYIDGYNNRNKWGFWNDLRKKLETILETANKRTKARIITLCNPEQAKYFGLV